MERIQLHLAIGAFAALGLVSGCTSSSSARRDNDQIQRDHNVLMAVSKRLDDLSERTLALAEGQSGLEVRAATLERGASALESQSVAIAQRVEQLARVRGELVELRKQLGALQVSSEFEFTTETRLTQLEFDVGGLSEELRSGAVSPSRSVDSIWRRYVDQRNRITELDASLRVATPRP